MIHEVKTMQTHTDMKMRPYLCWIGTLALISCLARSQDSVTCAMVTVMFSFGACFGRFL